MTIADRIERWIDRIEVCLTHRMLRGYLQQMKTLAKEQGWCSSSSKRGYICTLDEPHLRHKAEAEDGRVIDAWIDDEDTAAINWHPGEMGMYWDRGTP